MAPAGKPTTSSTSRKRRQSTPASISSRRNSSIKSKASSPGSGANGSSFFKSPVSKLELARAEAAKLQQARVDASIERLASDKKDKRKSLNTPSSSSTSNNKRKREENVLQQRIQSTNEEQDKLKKMPKTSLNSITSNKKKTTEKRRATLNIRSLPSNQLSTNVTKASTIKRGIKRRSSRSPSPSLASQTRLQRPKVKETKTTLSNTSSSPSKRPESIFSRYSDASVQQEQSEKKSVPRYLERLEELRRLAATAENNKESKQTTESTSTCVPVQIDLNRVSNVTQLETVEGVKILETLLQDTTPRSERTQQQFFTTSRSADNTPSSILLHDWKTTFTQKKHLKNSMDSKQKQSKYDFSTSILKSTPAPSWHQQSKDKIEESSKRTKRRYVIEEDLSTDEEEDESSEEEKKKKKKRFYRLY